MLLLFQLINSLRSNKAVYFVNLLLRGRIRFWSYFPSKRTDFCIEGFPSSANSYAFNILQEAYPACTVAHHTHNILALKLAKQTQVKCIVVVRNPTDAIASIVTRRHSFQTVKAISVGYYLSQYIYFHKYVYSDVENIFICPFEFITKSPHEFLNQTSEFLGKQISVSDFQIFEQKLQKKMTNWYHANDRMNDGVPLPGNERKSDRSIVVKHIQTHPLFSDATSIYDEVKQKAKSIA